jgi:EAL domain-containing protein (putative c-di-GMP-specific phosphodiesterase class I)
MTHDYAPSSKNPRHPDNYLERTPKRTIAELVGDDDTVELLKAHGVDYAQGDHLGKPRPVSVALQP